MITSRLFSSLTPSPSCRHIKTTSSQTWPKPYSKLQPPGGLFYNGFLPTMDYQEMSERTSLQRRVRKENSLKTKSTSGGGGGGGTLIRAPMMPWSQRDYYHLLSREQQVILVRLCTGHNRLNSHMHSKLKQASSPTFPCAQEDQTTEHVLHKTTREDVRPVSTPLTTQLYG